MPLVEEAALRELTLRDEQRLRREAHRARRGSERAGRGSSDSLPRRGSGSSVGARRSPAVSYPAQLPVSASVTTCSL